MGKEPLISVIIPTYNRAGFLEQSLKSLTHQSLACEQYEVIVIDDGSTDDTVGICNKFHSQLQLKYIYQRNNGNAAAKNLGIFASHGHIVFFFDDDDVADSNLLAEHVKTHKEYPQENDAVLGYTGWSPSLDVTPLMHYVTDVSGLLFSYSSIEDGKFLDFTYFWGGRSSCKRSLLVKHGIFNQNFRWTQDIELGYRLSHFGLRVVFNRNAVSYMIRPVTFDQFCGRCEKKGRAKFMLSRLHTDPVILTYSSMDNAEEKWKRAQKTLSADVQKVHQIESMIANESTNNEKDQLVKELWDFYKATFKAFELRGMVRAINEYGRMEETDCRLKLTDNDVDYFSEKWAHEEGLLYKPIEGHRDKVLVITSTPPMFDRASGEFRLYQMVKILNKHFDVVFLACDARGSERYVEYLRELGITVYCNDVERFPYLNGVEGIRPLDLEIVLEHNNFKAAFLMFYHISEKYIDLIRQYSPQTAVITDSVDLHFLREFREADIKQDKERLFKAEENKKRELATYERSDVTITVTEDDKSILLEESRSLDVRIIPNIHEITDNEISENGRHGLIFVGGFSHPPNIDAMLYFCKEVFPLIQRKITDVTLMIVGNTPPRQVLDLQDKNIIITGYVPETKPYLDSALISIAPLRYGAGMKGKIGEALANGLPVVTTSIGAEGMGAEDGEQLLIADNSEDFAQAVINLYNNKMLWESLSKKGRKLISDNYSIYAVEKSMLNIMKSLPAPGIKSIQRFSITPPASGCKIDIRVHNKVTAIVPVFNNYKRVQRCIENILKNTDNLNEIIVVDNGSSDDISDWLERKYVKYIRNEHKNDLKYVCMQGMQVCSSQYAAIIDSDTVVTPQWDTRLISHLKNRKNLAAVAPMLPDQNNYHTFYQLENLAWQIYKKNKGKLKESNDISSSSCILLDIKAIYEGEFCQENLKSASFPSIFSSINNSGLKVAFAKDVVVHYEKKYSTSSAYFNEGKMPVKLLSVIISGYTNKETLRATVKCLVRQSLSGNKFEIIVLDSRKEHGIKKMIKSAYPGINIKLIQGTRDLFNYALNEAAGEYVLFVKQDLLADKHLLEEHLRIYDEMSLDDIVVLGNTRFFSEMRDNTFLDYLNAINNGIGNVSLSFDPYYGTSISAKKEAFLSIGMNDEVVFGWQIREFLYNAKLDGRTVITNKNAVVYPQHALRLEEMHSELEKAGKEFVILSMKHPNRAWSLQDARQICQKDSFGKKSMIRTALELCHELERLPVEKRDMLVLGEQRMLDVFYTIILNYYYAEGIHSALTEVEGEDWLERFLQSEYEDEQNVVKMIKAENNMYEQLIRSIVEDRHGDLTESVKHAEDAVISLPAAPHPYFYLGEYYLRAGRFDMAETSYETCIVNQSKHSEYTREIIPVADYVSNNLFLAFSCMNQRKYNKAIKIVEGLIENNYIFKRNQELICNLYLAKCYESKGMVLEAIKYYQGVLEKEAGNAEAAYNLSVLYLKLDEEHMAMSILRKYAKENTGHVSLLTAKDGNLTVTARTKGQSISLHSRYRPYKESEDVLAQAGELKDKIIVQIGMGLGYPVLAIWNRISKNTPVLAVERDEALLNLALVNNLWDDFTSNEHFTVLAGKRNVSEVLEKLNILTSTFPDKEVVVIKHSPSFQLYPEYYNSIHDKVVEFVSNRARENVGA